MQEFIIKTKEGKELHVTDTAVELRNILYHQYTNLFDHQVIALDEPIVRLVISGKEK